MKFILGLKLGMSQVFDDKNNIIPVTLIKAGPCYIAQIKKKEKDKYEAVQLGFEEKKRITKPLQGHLKKTGKKLRFLKEFKVKIDDFKELKEGDAVDVSVFKEGDRVSISGISKGKGFAGGVKKWGFKGRPSTHGTKHEERTIGSTGSRFPQRVRKGKKMPGRMGSQRVTVKNLKIIKIDAKNNLLAMKGAIPGRKGTLLEIRG